MRVSAHSIYENVMKTGMEQNAATIMESVIQNVEEILVVMGLVRMTVCFVMTMLFEMNLIIVYVERAGLGMIVELI